jgi:hypothetical protein
MITSAIKSLQSVSTSSWWHALLFYSTAIIVKKPQDIPALNKLTNAIEQSPYWQAKRFSSSQEIPPILGIPKVSYHTRKSPPLAPNLSQINPAQYHPSYSLKIHFNISSHLRLDIPSGLFSSGFSTKTLCIITRN